MRINKLWYKRTCIHCYWTRQSSKIELTIVGKKQAFCSRIFFIARAPSRYHRLTSRNFKDIAIKCWNECKKYFDPFFISFILWFEYQSDFKLDVICDWNMINNEIYLIGNYLKIIRFKITNKVTSNAWICINVYIICHHTSQ